MRKSYILAILAFFACGKQTDNVAVETDSVKVTKSGAVIVTDPKLQPVEQQFHSAANPHGLENEKKNHVPLIRVTEESRNKQYGLEVSVPLTGDGKHYVENMILINHRREELAKMSFERGNESATAKFKLSRKPEDRYFIVAKCSIHDAWLSEVVLPKIVKEAE